MNIRTVSDLHTMIRGLPGDMPVVGSMSGTLVDPGVDAFIQELPDEKLAVWLALDDHR